MFDAREVELLARPNVVAYVVTADLAARRFAALGIEKPVHVVPQGVSLAALDPPAVAAVAQCRRDGEAVVGYVSALLLLDGDRGGGNPLYNVEHLLELWQEIRARIPARLWLVGRASGRLRRRLAGRDDVVLFGYVPSERVLAHVVNFDVALYPRTRDEGVRAAKIAEYLGAGVPSVSYDYEVTSDLRETGAGLLARTPREFVDAVVRVATDPDERRRLATAARAAGNERDWDPLALAYDAILDRHLPPDTLLR